MDGTAARRRALAALLIALRNAGETVTEITEFARVMRERATPVRCEARVILDTCGTGGDGAGTSTSRHSRRSWPRPPASWWRSMANRSVSSRLRQRRSSPGPRQPVDVPAETVERSLREIGIGFLYAPRLHDAMRHAAPVRRELGRSHRVQPARAPDQSGRRAPPAPGLYDPARLEIVAEVSESSARRGHGGDGEGLDEIALHGRTRVAELDSRGDRVR